MRQNEATAELVRRSYSVFMSRDKKAFEQFLSDDFAFHSPHDPHLDKAGFFERCWPNGDNVRSFRIEKLFEQAGEVFVRYEMETKTGDRFRNTEFVRVEGNKIKDVEVYYGSLPR